MRAPDATPALGAQLVEPTPDFPPDRTVAPSSQLHDSDPHAHGTAVMADSASYDTDLDTHPAVFHPVKPSNHIALPFKPNTVRPFPLCLPIRRPGFPADGEGLPLPPPPQGLPTCGDFLRHMCFLARQAVRHLRDAAFKPPGDPENVGPLWSLVTRQVPTGLREWESYHEELAEREEGGRGAPRRSLLGLPLLHPFCGAALGWSTAMLLFDLVFTAFWVPINVAFCLDQYGRLDALCTRTDLAGGIVYLVNILLGFQIGVTLTFGYRSRVVLDGRDAAALYASTLPFWLDVLAVTPFVYLLAVLGLGDSVTRHQTVSIISLMRLVRLFRVASIIKQLYSSSSGGEVESSWVANHFSVTPLYMALLTYLAMVLVNLYSCLLLLIAHYEQQRGRASWMSSVAWEDLAAAGAAVRWYNAVYFCITVMTTTGYADFVPKSFAEQALVSLVMLNGLVIFGTVVALIGSALKRSQENAQRAYDNRKKMTHVRQWLQEGSQEGKPKVDPQLSRDVLTFFAELSARRDGGRTESDIVFELPSHLRQEVSCHVVKQLLEECPLLKTLPKDVRELLAARFVPIELPTGHELFLLGDDLEGGGGGGLWLLEEGMVSAHRNKERMEMPAGPNGLGAPCLLGEGAILADIIPTCSSRMWTLRTERPCRFWQLREPALRATLQIYPTIASHLMTFVRNSIISWLAGPGYEAGPPGSRPKLGQPEGWCEVVQLLKRSFVTGPLRDRIQDCFLALQLASVQDGTLTQLLSAWLEMSVAGEMTVGDTVDELEQPNGVTSAVDGPSWTTRAATANPDKFVTPAATPEREPSSPYPSASDVRTGGDGEAADVAATAVTAVIGGSNAATWATGVDPDVAASSGGGGGDGGGVGPSQLALPMPPAAALSAATSLPPRPPGPSSHYFRGRRSDSGRSSASTLPPVVEQPALARTENKWHSSGGDGGEGDGGDGCEGSDGRSAGASIPETGVPAEGGHRRTYSNLAAGAGDAVQALPVSGAAVAAGQEGSSVPAMGSSALASGPTPTAAAPPPPPPPPNDVSPFTLSFAAVPAALQDNSSTRDAFGAGASPVSADANGTASVMQAALPSSGGGQRLSPHGGGREHQQPARSWSASAPEAAAPTSMLHASSQPLLSIHSVDGVSPPRAGGQLISFDEAGAWLVVPAEAEAEGTAWRAVSSFNAGGRGGGGQHVLLQPASRRTSLQRTTSPSVLPHMMWYDIAPGSAAAAAAEMAAAAVAARIRSTPMSPQKPVHTSQQLMAPPPLPPPPPPDPVSPAAAALVRQPDMHSTFLHNIFLAAGVHLKPRLSELPDGRAATAAAPAGSTVAASPVQPQGLIVSAAACSFCGCATCAYCARPIVPQGAAAAVRELEPAARGPPIAAPAAFASIGVGVGFGAPLSPSRAGSETISAANAFSGSKGLLLGYPAGQSRSVSGVNRTIGGGAGSRPVSGVNQTIGGEAGGRPVSGLYQTIGGGEYDALAPVPSVTRLPVSPSVVAAGPAPHSPMGRLVQDCCKGPRIPLPRAGPAHQSSQPVVQLSAFARLRSSSGMSSAGAEGASGGGSAAVDSGRGRLGVGVGGGSGGSGRLGGGDRSVLSNVRYVDSGCSTGGRGDGSIVAGDSTLTPGAALALAASVAGLEERPADGEGEEQPEGLPHKKDALLNLLPRSGTFRII